MISYADLRVLHVLFAIISLSGFALRGGLMLFDSPMLQRPWLRIAPHLNDSLLLAAAIGLAVMIGRIETDEIPDVMKVATGKTRSGIAGAAVCAISIKPESGTAVAKKAAAARWE